MWLAVFISANVQQFSIMFLAFTEVKLSMIIFSKSDDPVMTHIQVNVNINVKVFSGISSILNSYYHFLSALIFRMPLLQCNILKQIIGLLFRCPTPKLWYSGPLFPLPPPLLGPVQLSCTHPLSFSLSAAACCYHSKCTYSFPHHCPFAIALIICVYVIYCVEIHMYFYMSNVIKHALYFLVTFKNNLEFNIFLEKHSRMTWHSLPRTCDVFTINQLK